MRKIGLIIGSFDPVHMGHLNMIKFGARNCDELNVLVCATTEQDVFSGELRFEWMKELVKDFENVKVSLLSKIMPDSEYSSVEVSKVWAKHLKEEYPEVNLIISSEKYGDYLAEFMTTANNKVVSMVYDIDRQSTPISSTKIRNNPIEYWDFIPDVVKPYFVKRICIYGPESTGKSTLTKLLAKHFHTSYVEEMAREIIEQKKLDLDHLTIENLEEFAKVQSEEVVGRTKHANKYLFCDTDNLTTQIYSKLFCGSVSEKIIEYDNIKYDLYLLLDIDVPWVDDPQRNLQNQRKEMMDRFRYELDKRNIQYVIINGSWEERLNKSIEVINNKFQYA